MNKEKITELYRTFELTKDDVFKHKHYLIITRSGVERIQSKSNIEVNFNLEKCEHNFAVVKAVAFKRDAPDIKIETYGSALKGANYQDGSTNSWYVTELAEKRALSRAILKLVGAYQLGIFGEDESDEFKRK
tara:strand:+ start:11420 stop:11815 length:396 start_codon:yes stop_codon:yes gene_type:complete